MQSHKVIIGNHICALSMCHNQRKRGDRTVSIADLQVRTRRRLDREAPCVTALNHKQGISAAGMSHWSMDSDIHINKSQHRQDFHLQRYNTDESFSPDGFNNMHGRICCFFPLFFFLFHSFLLFCYLFGRLKIPATVPAVGYWWRRPNEQKNIKNASYHMKWRKVRDTPWPPST